jgi:hypothetical protein
VVTPPTPGPAPAAAPQPTTSEAEEERPALGKWRTGGAFGLVFPLGDLGDSDTVESPSILVSGRFGKEVHRAGNLAVVPAARANVVYWRLPDAAGDSTLLHLHVGGELRVVGIAGQFMPWGSVGLGIDHNIIEVTGFEVSNGTGFGINAQAGIDFPVSDKVVLGAGVLWHPGFSPIAGEDGAVDVNFMSVVLHVTHAP